MNIGLRREINKIYNQKHATCVNVGGRVKYVNRYYNTIT